MSIYIKPYGCAAEEPTEVEVEPMTCPVCHRNWWYDPKGDDYECTDSDRRYDNPVSSSGCPVCTVERSPMAMRRRFVVEEIYHAEDENESYAAMLVDLMHGVSGHHYTKPTTLGGLMTDAKWLWEQMVEVGEEGEFDFINSIIDDNEAEFYEWLA